MKVVLNPVNTNRNNYFKSSNKSNNKTIYTPEKSSEGKPTENKIMTAKTKKVISELRYVVVGVVILYFAMKLNLKLNKIKQKNNLAAELEKMTIQAPILMDENAIKQRLTRKANP